MSEDEYNEITGDDNLANLPDISSESITHTLTTRYLCHKIYTYIGDILIALNPFEHLGIYSDYYMNKYSTQNDIFTYPPHLFSISQTSFNNLKSKGHNQCCVISGESGSGKTETAKLLMRYLSHSCDTLVPDLPNQCHQMNPLIEAFGNAKTVMNDNSSRFGKYVEMQFTPTGELVGAKITEYLLEKSRVISHAEGEQNFHIFYYIYAGLTPEYLNKLKLDISSTHRYLASNSVDAVILNDVSNQRGWRDRFQEVVVCFQTLGFSKELLFQMLSVLITILYIGDIEFSMDEDEYACVSSSGMLMKVAGILGVPSRKLNSVLTSITSTIQGGEVVCKRCDLEKSTALRDATAKAIYSRLFSWIIAQMNASLGKSHWSGKVISVLDIFGFENFKVNYFEQLCIDTANEQLQFYFNQHIFAWEVEEYRLEGVPLENIEFVNNKQICDLLLKRPGGLFALLDEESVFPKATDQTFLHKIRTQCGKNNEEILSFPRSKNLNFSINHFAGKVEYSCQDILEKNRDTLSDNIVQLLENCEHYLIRELFNNSSVTRIGNLQIKSKYLNCPRRAHSMRKTWSRSTRRIHSNRRPTQKKRESTRSPSHGGPPPTVGLMFRNSLCDLMEKMLSCDPHFVRCIKPNKRLFPGLVDKEFIERQLRSTGVLETVRIRQNGYSYRPDFATFFRLYGTLAFPYTSHPEANKENCSLLLDRLGMHNWVMGESRVFLKYYHPSQLDVMRGRELVRIVITQRMARGFLARREMSRRSGAAKREEETVLALCEEIQNGTDLMSSQLNKLNSRDEDEFISLKLNSIDKLSDCEETMTPTISPEPITPTLETPLIEFPPPPDSPPSDTSEKLAEEAIAKCDELGGIMTDDSTHPVPQSLLETGCEDKFSEYFEPVNLPAKLRTSNSFELPFTPVINKKRLSRHSISGASGGGGALDTSHEIEQSEVNKKRSASESENLRKTSEGKNNSCLAPKPRTCLTQSGGNYNWLRILCYVGDMNMGDFQISQPSIVIDGSKNIFDPSCISLGTLMASVSNKKSINKRASYIGKGIQIFRDEAGDVFCKRMSKKMIRIVNFEDKCFYSRKLSDLKGCLPQDELVKILDFAKFRDYIADLSSSEAIMSTPVESMLELKVKFEVHKDVKKIPRIELWFLEAIEYFKQICSQPLSGSKSDVRITESVSSEYEASYYRDEDVQINESLWVNIYRTHNRKRQKSQCRNNVVASSVFMSENAETQDTSTRIQNEELGQGEEGTPLEVEFTGPIARRARDSKRVALNTKSADVDQLIRTTDSISCIEVRDRPKSTELESIQVSPQKLPAIASLPETQTITLEKHQTPDLPPLIQVTQSSQKDSQNKKLTKEKQTNPSKDPPPITSGKVTITSVRRRNREMERKRVSELLNNNNNNTSTPQSNNKDEERPVYLVSQPTLQPHYAHFHGRSSIPVIQIPDNVIQMHKALIEQADELSKMKKRLFSNDISVSTPDPCPEGLGMLTRKKWHRPMTKRLVESRPLLSRATSKNILKK